VCSLVCISRALPRHLRGFDLLGAKSGATAGEHCTLSGRRNRNAAESKGVTARRDLQTRHLPTGPPVAHGPGVLGRRSGVTAGETATLND
jgi:hypothetical protein